MWTEDPGTFTREFCQRNIDEWKLEEMERRGGRDKTFSDPYFSCKYGHGQGAMNLVSHESGFESVICMACVQRDNFPISTFNYQRLMVRFNDLSIYSDQSFDCKYCRSSPEHTAQGNLTLLDIVQPEVFISYHTGYPKNPDYEKEITPQVAQAKEIADMIKLKADILCWVTQKPPTENAQEHWIQTMRAIKNCKIFVVLLSDAYCNNKSCRREFEHAVQCGKYMIPVLIRKFEEEEEEDIMPERDDETGWMGPVTSEFLASGNWWNHALRVCNLQQHHNNMQIQWSILKYFEPISLHPNTKHPEDEKFVIDIYWKVIEHLWGSSVVDHHGKRSYNEWKGARQNLMSEINRLANKEDTDLPVMEQMELRAQRLFQQLDTDGILIQLLSKVLYLATYFCC